MALDDPDVFVGEFIGASSGAGNPPDGGEKRSEGDDHLRSIKGSLGRSFPNVMGAVSASHTELNNTVGTTSAIQTQIDAVNTKFDQAFPVGTLIWFFQASIPPGWEIDIDTEADLGTGDRAIFVTGAGGGGYTRRGGFNDPKIYVDVAPHQHPFTVTQADHRHGLEWSSTGSPNSGFNNCLFDGDDPSQTGLTINNNPPASNQTIMELGGGFTFNGDTGDNPGAGGGFLPRYHVGVIGKKT